LHSCNFEFNLRDHHLICFPQLQSFMIMINYLNTVNVTCNLKLSVGRASTRMSARIIRRPHAYDHLKFFVWLKLSFFELFVLWFALRCIRACLCWNRPAFEMIQRFSLYLFCNLPARCRCLIAWSSWVHSRRLPSFCAMSRRSGTKTARQPRCSQMSALKSRMPSGTVMWSVCVTPLRRDQFVANRDACVSMADRIVLLEASLSPLAKRDMFEFVAERCFSIGLQRCSSSSSSQDITFRVVFCARYHSSERYARSSFVDSSANMGRQSSGISLIRSQN